MFSHGNVCGVSACCPSICNDSVEHRFVSCSDVLFCCVWGHVVLWCGRLFYCAVLICRRLCCGSKRNAVPSCEGALNFNQRMWIVCSLVLRCVVFFCCTFWFGTQLFCAALCCNVVSSCDVVRTMENGLVKLKVSSNQRKFDCCMNCRFDQICNQHWFQIKHVGLRECEEI